MLLVMPLMQDASPVFLGGLHRSGTTLLASILASHSLVAGLQNTGVPEDEGQFLQDVYPVDQVLGARGLGRGCEVRWAFNPAAHMIEADLAAVPSIRDRFERAWSPHFPQEQAKFWLEKTPSNVVRMRFLKSVFPDARLVVITRNPIVYALAIRKWGSRANQVGLGLDRIVAHWLTAMRQFESDLAHLTDVCVLSYEQLVTNPRDTVGRVLNFLELEGIDARQLARVGDGSARYSDYWSYMQNARWFDRPPFAISQFNSPKSHAIRALERAVVPVSGPRTVRRVIERHQHDLRHFGYDADSLQTVPDQSWAGVAARV